MVETNTPLPMTVAFTGYKIADHSDVHEIGEPSYIPPVEDCGEDQTSYCYNLLQKERIQEYEKLKPPIYASVSCKNVYHDRLICIKKETLQLSSCNGHSIAKKQVTMRLLEMPFQFFLRQFTQKWMDPMNVYQAPLSTTII